MSLTEVPDELLIEEAKRRDKEHIMPKKSREVMRKCLGCKKKFNARDMRSHPCKVGWTKRIPYKIEKRGDDYAYVLDDE